MASKPRLKTACLVVAISAATTIALMAQEPKQSDVRLREADAFLSNLQYEQAAAAYRQARATDDARIRVRAGAGLTRTLLRLGQFEDAEREAITVVSADPSIASAMAVHGDALWAAGLFEEAEARYTAALRLDPRDPAALHGRARSLAAQSQFDDALAVATRALADAPNEPEYLYTLAWIHEKRGEYSAAVDALERYIQLLPPGDQTHLTKWARTQEQFLRSFGKRTPLQVTSREPPDDAHPD